MSALLSINYSGPIRFDEFTAETRGILAGLVRRAAVPELIEFSAPSLPSTRPRRQSLGPEPDWLLLGFEGIGYLFEFGVCPDLPKPWFAVELNSPEPLARAAAVSAAAAIARLAGAD